MPPFGAIQNNQGKKPPFGAIQNNQDVNVQYAHPTPVGWSLNNSITLEDPVHLAQSCIKEGLSVDSWRWKVNTVIWPSGVRPGKVSLLLRRSDIERSSGSGGSLDRNGLHTIAIRYGETRIEFRNMVLSAPLRNVTPSYHGSKSAIYLLEFSDLRHVLLNAYYGRPLNRQYNVIAADTGTVGEYYHASLRNGTTAYTWQTMLNDIWSQMSVPDELSSSPQLPFTPNGTPQNWRFVGVPAWIAYNQVLSRLGCRFVLYPNTQKAIVRIGVDDPVFHNAMNLYDNTEYRLEDEEPFQIVRGQVPRQFVVYFSKIWAHYGTEDTTEWRSGPPSQTSMDSVYSLTFDCPTAISSQTQAGSQAYCWDDMAAMVGQDGTTILNSSDLLSRATERANDYYRMVYSGGNRMHKTFRGFLDHDGILPSSEVAAVAWMDHGFGARTEIVQSADPVRFDESTGRWVEEYESVVGENLRGPDYNRKTFANYPLTQQIVRNLSTTPVGGVYDATLMHPNPETLTLSSLHSVWLWNLNP